ncbi:malto-oligosyltrehalose trehalohydrolase [Caenimonas terrae]|uniref:Malto-oligosyltrehalose trehalohydrolase n=1 Tax=Caenimonas terrae TaxID=696074 RepID=A0ABW0NBB0_9BURK
MPFGAAPRAGGGVDFRLWAPAAQRCDLVLGASGEQLLAAERDADGWWHCFRPGAAAGSRYRWRIDGGLLAPDPASRSNPDGVHHPSCVVDPARFEWDEDWRGRPWSEVVLYELHVGAFTPEGTFAAAASKLAQLAALGITAIELMPVGAYGGRFGWGYDGVLPYAPHPAYGSPEDLKQLVQQAHRLGLMVFLDVVYNHFGPDGNYLHAYAPQFFSATHQSPWGAALNFDGPGSRPVREFFIHNALYWIEEYRIDGLRLDAVHAIVDASRPDLLEELSSRVRAAAGGRHVHLVGENEDNVHQRLAPRPQPGCYDGQWNDDFHHALFVALTGDSSGYYHDYGSRPVDLLARALTHGMLFEGSHRWPGGAREQCIAAPPQHLPAMVNAAHNHDQVGNRAFGERLARLVPPPAAELATLLALLTPATPLLLFGEETGADTPFLYFADWEGELRDAVRSGRRREFSHAAKGADGQAHELPDPCSEATFASTRLDDEHRHGERGRRWLQMVGDALAMRRQFIVPRQHLLLQGEHRSGRVGATGIRVRWNYAGGAVLALDLNIGPAAIDVPASGEAAGQVLFAHGRGDRDPRTAHWPAWSALWWLGNNGATSA